MFKKILIFLFVLMVVFINVYAHPGNTDSQGGHYNRSTGEYHYHHGEPEHQHPNGVCPYDESESEGFRIMTQDEYRAYKGLPPLEEEEEEEAEEETPIIKKIIGVSVGFWWLILPIVLWIYDSLKKKQK